MPAKTVHGTGVLVSTRAVIWGTGYVLNNSSLRTATPPDKPTDESVFNPSPVNVPGSTWSAQ